MVIATARPSWRKNQTTSFFLLCPCEDKTCVRTYRVSPRFMISLVLLLFFQGILVFHLWSSSSSSGAENSRRTAQFLTYDLSSLSPARSVSSKDPLAWTSPWTGLEFAIYKEHIDGKIRRYRARDKKLKTKNDNYNVCEMNLYDGEYGYELAGIIPWAYWKFEKENCLVHTRGRPGTKYLYYFSQHHDIEVKQDGLQRQSHSLPKESPFGFNVDLSPHFHDSVFPKTGWKPPPYKQFFQRTDVHLDKPLMVLSNKYTYEWSGEQPRNNIPIRHLQEVLKRLTQKYRIVYVRFQDRRLEDRQERKIRESGKLADYGDKEMIRHFFPSVVLFEELTVGLDLEEINLMLFSLYATSENFISVQGGNSVVASFFGGRNLIFCEEGPELSDSRGDFSYYHRFSGAKIQVTNNATLMNHVDKWYCTNKSKAL